MDFPVRYLLVPGVSKEKMKDFGYMTIGEFMDNSKVLHKLERIGDRKIYKIRNVINRFIED